MCMCGEGGVLVCTNYGHQYTSIHTIMYIKLHPLVHTIMTIQVNVLELKDAIFAYVQYTPWSSLEEVVLGFSLESKFASRLESESIRNRHDTYVYVNPLSCILFNNIVCVCELYVNCYYYL